MKPFTEFLMDVRPKYEFTIRMANCETTDLKTRLESALGIYVVESVTEPKRLPIQEHADFPGKGACEVQIIEVTLKYPTITPQIRQLVAEKLNIPAGMIVVRTKKEEALREPMAASPKDKNGSILTNPGLEAESAQELVGLNRALGLLKELQSIKFELASKGDTDKSIDMPQGTKSPVGSNQNKIPGLKGK
jgi:hypothetical protein